MTGSVEVSCPLCFADCEISYGWEVFNCPECGMDAPTKCAAALSRAKRAKAAGDFSRAAELYKGLFDYEIENGNTDDDFIEQITYSYLREYSESLDQVNRLGESTQAYVAYLDAYAGNLSSCNRKRNRSDALDFLSMMLRIEGGKHQLADRLQEESIKLRREANEEDPDAGNSAVSQIEELLAQGCEYFQSKQLSDALRVMVKANEIRTSPSAGLDAEDQDFYHVAIAYNMANVLYFLPGKGNLKDAIDLLEEALEVCGRMPDNAVNTQYKTYVLSLLGVCLLMSGQIKKGRMYQKEAKRIKKTMR